MKTYNILGMMSGTSLDGLDLAACRLHLHRDGKWTYEILASASISYDNDLRGKLSAAMELPAVALLKLHHEYGRWLGEQALDFLREHALEIDYIASHGHTVHHRPEEGFTFQIGEGQEIAVITQLPVIYDFRSADVALGGQGAPLVPIGDRLLFGNYDACLNLGGISNISFEQDGKRLAYDIGLANMPLNYLSRKNGKQYDNGGALARSGVLDSELLKALNDLEFYSREIPRSTGAEWFTASVVPLLEHSKAAVPDLLHTTTMHVVEQLKISLVKHAGNKFWKVLLTGGGAKNDFLVGELKKQLPPHIQLEIPDNELLEQKEALLFALLGALRVEGQVNVLASVTGASQNSCSGVLIYPPLKQ